MKTLFSGLHSITCKQTLKKFQAIVLGRKAYNGCKSFRVSDTDIKCEESVKLLGVTVDYLLNFDLHISNMCKKAAKQINVLLRLSNYINMETKLIIYKSFIRSNFSYCPLVCTSALSQDHLR